MAEPGLVAKPALVSELLAALAVYRPARRQLLATLGLGQKVQVRYLANPSEVWVNEHLVYRIAGVEWYALVLFESFAVTAVVAFPQELTAIGAELGKRHPRQNETLQFTRRSYWAMRDNPDRFRSLGMQIWLPPFR